MPYARYAESIDSVSAQIEAMRPRLAAGLTRTALQDAMPPGAARNALDCAFWDLEAKRAGRPVHELAGLPAPQPVTTAYTISLAAPAEMAKATAKAAHRSLLKIKLGAPGDPERIAAVRAAAPATTLIVDANEGWAEDNLAANLAACAEAGVVLVEQPLPEGRDQALAKIKRPIPVCADESAHGLTSLPALAGRYDAVNVKLDKAGGLTGALGHGGGGQAARFHADARQHGGDLAVGRPGHAGRPDGPLRRSRRAAAARRRPAQWPRLPRQPGLSGDPGFMGLTAPPA